jgi:predicted neutral ceramidase superfamily lipid hydrolase
VDFKQFTTKTILIQLQLESQGLQFMNFSSNFLHSGIPMQEKLSDFFALIILEEVRVARSQVPYHLRQR